MERGFIKGQRTFTVPMCWMVDSSVAQSSLRLRRSSSVVPALHLSPSQPYNTHTSNHYFWFSVSLVPLYYSSRRPAHDFFESQSWSQTRSQIRIVQWMQGFDQPTFPQLLQDRLGSVPQKVPNFTIVRAGFPNAGWLSCHSTNQVNN